MKETYSKNLTTAFQYLKNYGREDIVSICKTDPRLGSDPFTREVNSWLTILDYLIKCHIKDWSDGFFEKEFDKFFMTVPIIFRDIVYPRIDKIARDMGISIEVDFSNCKPTKGHLVEHIDPDDVRIVLKKLDS